MAVDSNVLDNLKQEIIEVDREMSEINSEDKFTEHFNAWQEAINETILTNGHGYLIPTLINENDDIIFL